MKYLNLLKQGWKGIFLAICVGVVAIIIKNVFKHPVLDPLLVALAIGIIIRSFIKLNDKYISGFTLASSLFIPVGVILYGAVNLNFAKFGNVDTNSVFLLFIVCIVYVISTLVLSNLFGLTEKQGYLIATGSTICGASAIAITSGAIEAEPDDVSNSLIPVYISALIGLFVILPVLAAGLKMSDMDYGIFSGTVLQFTGFVKAAVSDMPAHVKTTALSVKAVRYVGLLFLIPLFSSFVKRRFHIPWFLWFFLGAGVAFSLMPELAKTLRPSFKLILTVLWSIAMGAIGLSADIKKLFTKTGMKALGASFISFLVAIAIYIVGIKML